MTNSTTDSMVAHQIFEDLIVSVLAVNNYSLHKAYGLLYKLREVGILDLSVLSGEALNAREIRGKLVAAGYNRGEYVEVLISERIEKILSSIRGMGSDDFLLSLVGDSSLIAQKLSGLYGVGPRVISNFINLRDFPNPSID